jgi:hypothetical protein
MRTEYKNLILVVLMASLVNTLNAANFSTSLSINWSTSQSWTSNSTWVSNHPNPTNLNQDKIYIGRNGSGFPAHHVILNGDLIGKNGVVIDIYPNSTLEIIGDLTVQNNFIINVYAGATFLLNGNVSINAGAGESAADLIINGEANITGSITGNGNISGTGSLSVDGSIASSITINPNNEDSVNVIGTSSTYCPPVSLSLM